MTALGWLLVAGAVVHLAVWAWVNWYRIFGPYLILRIEDLSSIVLGVAPFLLGAAALFGAVRWPAGRRWLVAGAVLSGIHGLGQLTSDAWWAWIVAADIMPPEGAAQAVFVVLALVRTAAAALAVVCLAIGLSRASARRPFSAPLLIVPLVVGVAALAGSLGLLGRELAWTAQVGVSQQAAYVVLGGVHRVLATVGDVGMVALAIVALRVMPLPIAAPELLIAVGALLVAATRAASSIGQALLSIEAQSEAIVWVFTVPFAIGAIGLTLLVAGFGLAAVVARPRRARPDPRAAEPTGTLAG